MVSLRPIHLRHPRQAHWLVLTSGKCSPIRWDNFFSVFGLQGINSSYQSISVVLNSLSCQQTSLFTSIQTEKLKWIIFFYIPKLAIVYHSILSSVRRRPVFLFGSQRRKSPNILSQLIFGPKYYKCLPRPPTSLLLSIHLYCISTHSTMTYLCTTRAHCIKKKRINTELNKETDAQIKILRPVYFRGKVKSVKCWWWVIIEEGE